jgi:hypothetical protein
VNYSFFNTLKLKDDEIKLFLFFARMTQIRELMAPSEEFNLLISLFQKQGIQLLRKMKNNLLLICNIFVTLTSFSVQNSTWVYQINYARKKCFKSQLSFVDDLDKALEKKNT